MTDQPRVIRNEDKDRYEIWSGDALAGFSVYQELGKQTIFTHTEIDTAFAGQGLGGVLARGAVEDVISRDRIIIPLCPFVAAYLRKHPEYDASVRWQADRARHE